jgi:hypothetical protein
VSRIVEISTRSLYALAAAFYLLLGVVVLSLGIGILPTWLHDQIFAIGQNNPDTMHLIQETGTLWVLVGILFVWFARHYDQSEKFHWAVTFYLALDALVHWFNAYGRFEHEPRAIINGIPFVLFLIAGLLRGMHGIDRRTDAQLAPK